LLHLVRLPKSVSPVELVEMTCKFFEDSVDRASTCSDFGLELEELSIDRASIEDLVRCN
jgi:hypothetical protein